MQMSGHGRRGSRVVSVGDMLSASDMAWLAHGRMLETLQDPLRDSEMQGWVRFLGFL